MSKDVLISFEKALTKLDEALKAETSELIRDAAIQRFEFSYELMWKSLKHVLKDSGLICQSPKSCFKEAFSQGWIKDEELWLQMLSDRNLTTHTYDEILAAKVYKKLPMYLVAMLEILKHIKS
jgi:nucleotidyltransferase substrate binding protein (TIGR01987 family)